MINPRKWIVRVVYLASLCAFLICCNKLSENEAAPEEVKPSAAVEIPEQQPSDMQEEQQAEPNPQEVPVAEDFEAEVQETVNEENYRAQLERLEKEIESE